MKRLSHPDCAVCNRRLAYQRMLMDRWRAAGLCPSCGKPRQRFQYCADCRGIKRAHATFRRQRKAA